MNVLVVSPFFPPDKTVGALRMASLVRFLANNNVNVFVLTNEKKLATTENKVKQYFVDPLEGNISYFKRFKENQRRYCEAFLQLTKEYDFDAVIVSGGPFYTFDIAIKSKILGIPCVLDFRDPWIFDYRDAKSFFKIKNIIGRLIELQMERRAVHAATKVVTVTPGWVNLFKKFYPFNKTKFCLIENGYDDALLESISLPETHENEKLKIAVFGKTFYYTKKYSEVFISTFKEFFNEIDMLQVGTREKIADDLLQKYNMPPNTLETTGFLNYKDGIKILNTADVFVIIDVRKHAIGTKIYDYIFLNKPIIYVGPKKTAIADIVRKLEHGFVCENSSELTSVFNSLLKSRCKKLTNSNKFFEYSRSTQNERWHCLLKEVSQYDYRQKK